MKQRPYDLPSLLNILKFALENPNILTNGNVTSIRVKDIRVCNNDTLLCEYYSEYNKSLDIKSEMVIVLGCFNGFFRDQSFGGWTFQSYIVSAREADGQEIMYCYSPKPTAELIGTGNSIGWLKNSYFQENTSDFRLSLAKTMIADIENSLRMVIAHTLQSKFGATWWGAGIPGSIAKPIENIYKNQFGTSTSDGQVLINYTYTLTLKNIICGDWGTFRHLFDSQQIFDKTMTELNEIRREEAHNRTISHKHLQDLERIYKTLLGIIAQYFTDIQLVYVTENWRSKIKEIMLTTPNQIGMSIEDFDNAEIYEKVALIKMDTENIIKFTNDLLVALSSIVVPLKKQILHNTLIGHLEKYKNLFNEKLDMYAKQTTVGLEDLLIRIKKQEKDMDSFTNDLLLSES